MHHGFALAAHSKVLEDGPTSFQEEAGMSWWVPHKAWMIGEYSLIFSWTLLNYLQVPQTSPRNILKRGLALCPELAPPDVRASRTPMIARCLVNCERRGLWFETHAQGWGQDRVGTIWVHIRVERYLWSTIMGKWLDDWEKPPLSAGRHGSSG